jgi:hypothetical protein
MSRLATLAVRRVGRQYGKVAQRGAPRPPPSCWSATTGRPFSQQQQQQQQQQHTSEKRRIKQKKKKKEEDSFTTLGISRDISYANAKKAFLQIAMKHHPDTSDAASDDAQREHRDIFVAARKAFENIVEGPEGKAVLRSESDEAWEEEEFSEWFREETGGLDMPFMDARTMKEVAEMTDKIGGGLDRDGGM